MIEIKIRENLCKIFGDLSTTLLKELDEELSYKVPGAIFIQKKSGWDGRKYLMNKNLVFQYGLLARVTDFLNKNNEKFIITDERNISNTNSVDIYNNLKNINKSPREYQEDAAKLVFDYDCGIFKIPTGGGKTLIAALMTAHLGKSTNIYVIGTDLLYQMHSFFKEAFNGHKVGIIGDGHCDIGDINIVSIWTVGCAIGLSKKSIVIEQDAEEKSIEPEKYSQIRDLIKTTKVHIFDECHVCACKTITELSKNIRPEHIYGVSASPYRDDNQDLIVEAILGKKILEISASYLIDNGYLVQPIIKFEEVPKYPTVLQKNYNTIYKNYIIENDVRNQMVVDGTEKLISRGYKTLVLYNNINHGKMLYDQISKKLPCILLSGKDDNKIRQKAKDDITNNEINCILASKIFDIGVDIPAISGLVLAGSGKSSVRALQRIGRVIRPYNNKKYAAIIDFIDNAHYLKQHSKQRKKIYETEEKFEVIWPKKN